MHIELISRRVPIDDATLARRAETVQRLSNLALIKPDDGEIDETMQSWVARINGAEFPIADFGVAPAEDGTTPLVSLLLYADSVTVGEQEAESPASVAAESRPAPWGTPGRPDPREGIPGWSPNLAEQVARNAEAGA